MPSRRLLMVDGLSSDKIGVMVILETDSRRSVLPAEMLGRAGIAQCYRFVHASSA